MIKDYEAVGIGFCCEISFVISQLQLASKPYPFDWCLVKNIVDVAKIIESDFIDFENLHEETEDLYHPQVMLKIGNSDVYIPHALPTIKEDKQKHIQNFFELIESKKKIIFIYKGHIYRYPTINDFETFSNIIKKKYPSLEFKLVIVNEYDDTQDINSDYELLDNIMGVYNVIDLKNNIIKSENHKDLVLHDCSIDSNPIIIQRWTRIVQNLNEI